MTVFTYYNEQLDEIAGVSALLDWTGQSNPSSEVLQTLGIFVIEIPDEKAGIPFELVKQDSKYIAMYPTDSSSRFGFLSESDRGIAIKVVQTISPGQPIHQSRGTEKITIQTINDLPTDILLTLKWGEDSQANHRLRAASGMTTVPTLFLGADVKVSAWADTPGLLITGGWET